MSDQLEDEATGEWARRHFKYTLPWKLTSWGCLFGQGIRGTFIGFSADEYHNRTFYFMIPLVGFFTFWYEREINTSVLHLYGSCGGVMEGFIDPDCGMCAEVLGWFLVDDYATREVPSDARSIPTADDVLDLQ